MKKTNKFLVFGLFLVFALMLVGCGPTAEELAGTMVAGTEAAASPTSTETSVPTSTSTTVPTATVRPTQTPKPTKTLIPTLTPRPTDLPTATKEASSGGGGGGGGFSSGCTGSGCSYFRVNNKTKGPASITLWGEKENYYFYIPVGNGQQFTVYPGSYTIRAEYCGNVYSFTHALNSKWTYDMKCP